MVSLPKYLPPVFLLRYATAESMSLFDRYDAHNTVRRSFELDWQRMASTHFFTMLSSMNINMDEDDRMQLKSACRMSMI